MKNYPDISTSANTAGAICRKCVRSIFMWITMMITGIKGLKKCVNEANDINVFPTNKILIKLVK